MEEEIPFVSVLCLVYNQAPYVRQCLDSLVLQQTSFPYEIIVHDDASTDGSTEIIREYANRYPTIIKPILQKENQFSQHIPIVTTHMIPLIKGKYLAFCEGDDYWTDSSKLQKQFDFLEANPSYSMCIHGCQLYDQIEEKIIDAPSYQNVPETIYVSDLFYEPFSIASSSLFYRKIDSAEDKRKRMGDSVNVNGDTITLFIYGEYGKIGFIQDVMSVYRIGTGIWSTNNWFYQDLNSIVTCSKLYSIIEDEAARTKIAKLILSLQDGMKNTLESNSRALNSPAYKFSKKIAKPFRWIRRKLKTNSLT